MSDPHDLEQEPIPGLPEELPPGERIVWQGRPHGWALAQRAFKFRWLAAYFVGLILVRAGMGISSGDGASAALEVTLMTLLFGACLGLVALFAWLHARATVYTITTHRVVMRIGVALSTTWNLPFKQIRSADLAKRDKDGDIVLRLSETGRVRWLIFWPHVKFGSRLDACPTMTAIREPERVAHLLKEAVDGWVEQAAATPVVVKSAPPDSPFLVSPTLAAEG